MEDDFEVINVQGDSIKFRYHDLTFVAYVIENGKRIELPKRFWFEDSHIFRIVSRKAKQAWVEAQCD